MYEYFKCERKTKSIKVHKKESLAFFYTKKKAACRTDTHTVQKMVSKKSDWDVKCNPVIRIVIIEIEEIESGN